MGVHIFFGIEKATMHVINKIKTFFSAASLLVDAIASEVHALLDKKSIVPLGKVIYLSQYYECSNPARQQEIDDCVVYNSMLPWIDQFILLCEGDARPPACVSDVVKCIHIADRATFMDFLSTLMTIDPAENDVAIISNSDIFLDCSIYAVLPHIRRDDFLALNRYETNDSTTPFLMSNPRPGSVSWSQDTWILRCSLLKRIVDSNIPHLPLGVAGCENRFASFIYESGASISNPCLGVRTTHNHKSEVRISTPSDRLEGDYCFPRVITKNQFIFGTRIKPYCLPSHKS